MPDVMAKASVTIKQQAFTVHTKKPSSAAQNNLQLPLLQHNLNCA